MSKVSNAKYQMVGGAKTLLKTGKMPDTKYPTGVLRAAHNISQKKFGQKITPYGFSGYNLVPGYKKGGKVKKTGLAKVHKGEHVLTKKKAKQVEKVMNKYGKKL
jgi:hypothetical protein